MKKLILLPILFFCLALHAQTVNVNISGTVNDVDGAPIPNIFVTANAETASEPLYFTFTDSIGQYSFEFDDAIVGGCAYVELLNCDFTTLIEETCWSDTDEDFEVDFIYCEEAFIDTLCFVWVYENNYDFNEVELVAIANGVAPIQYEWNDGSNDPTLIITENGTYCVTITDADGCVSEFCYDFEFPSPCQSYIWQDYGFNSASLGVDSNGEYPLIYNWSTGDSSDVIEVFESGEYCVTIVDANDCEDVVCTHIDLFIDSTCFNFIYEIHDSLDQQTLVAEVWGLPPFVYLWSTGDTTESITPGEAGEYCLTVTDANGCVSENCYVIWGDCGAFVSSNPVPGATFLYSNAWGEWPITYQWSTGDTTESIQIFDAGDYCVTITDANDCTSESCLYVDPTENPFDSTCFVWVYEEYTNDGTMLVAETFGIPDVVYIWSTGDTTQTITVSEEGEYCVTAIYANGCTAESCYHYFPIQDCGVFLACDPNDDGSTIFVPEVWGVAPFTYLWSTGDTTETLLATEEGEYCVTVTDATGCQAEFCAFFTPFVFEDCNVFIIPELLDSATISLTAEVWTMDSLALVVWNTGDTTNTILVTESGTYCATATDGFGCISEACFDIDFEDINTGNPEDIQASIFGFVIGDNGDFAEADVLLYKENEVDGYDLVDSIPTLEGFAIYGFEALEDGNYLVKAIPSSEDYMPTYHENALLWEDANVISITNGEVVQADIFLISSNEGFGPGSVSGTITMEEGFYNNDLSSARSGEGIANVSLVVTTDLNVPVSHTMTDENGHFTFDDLAYGTYKIHIEVPGKNHGTQWFTIAPDALDHSVSFILEEDSGSFISSSEDLELINNVAILSNPVQERITIQFDNTEAAAFELSLHNLLGNNMMVQQTNKISNETIQLDATALSAGTYFLRVRNIDTEENRTFKILKL